MPATYAQLVEFALSKAAQEGKKKINLVWLRQQIRTQARRVKRRLGPQLNKGILRKLNEEVGREYLSLRQDSRNGDLSIYILAAGRHEYLTRLIPVTIEVQTTSARRTRSDLLWENEELKSQLLNIHRRLVRADSLIELENGGHAGVATGLPSAITERIQRLVALSKNRKEQLDVMYEDIQFQHNTELLNAYHERDMEEREARDSLIQELRMWRWASALDLEREIRDSGHGDGEDGQDLYSYGS